ncbi:LutC/YkgG family protein [Ornithinimicrobium sp. W1679]|uniref:LutC/YkgG family protein n=1 Tax=unclassified Ornithinimicrobium TaxID=2615080 RepID=UPI003CEB0683
MSTAREEILSRLRHATADVGTPVGHRGEVPLIQEVGESPEATVELFVENVADYRAEVVRCTPEEVAGTIAERLRARGSRSVVVPSGLDASWVAGLADDGVELLPDEQLSADQLDAVGAVITACRVGIATTGTIILDHTDDQGRRALSLVPDHHVCVVHVDQVVHDVPASLDRLDPTRAMTWISGPSATSDIELDRVEGVHGPRNLDVLVVG